MQVHRIVQCALWLTMASVAHADHWPAWRGPTADGVCQEKDVPLTWSADQNIRWKVPLPEAGNSTPAIWGDRVFVTQATDKGAKRSLICFNRHDGSRRWIKTIEYTQPEPTHSTNPFCAASPVTNGERVVVSHGSAGIACYDFDGNQLWHRDLGPCHHIWGTAASPVIAGDLVFLNFGPGERTTLYAFHLQDGTDAWKVDEPGGKLGDKGAAEWIGSWSTPVLAKVGEQTQLVLSWPGAIKAYDPLTGRHLWTCQGLFKDDAQDKLVYTNPLFNDQVIVAMGGFQGAWIGMKVPTESLSSGSDITESHRLWRNPKGPQRIGSGMIVGDHVYIVNENGTVQCIEWKTGKILGTERLTGNTWASLVRVGDRLYTTSLEGETVVFAAKPKLDVLARNVISERTLASLAISNGEIFLRTHQHLWCIADGE